MYQNVSHFGIDTQCLGSLQVVDFMNHLKLGKMVATANGAKAGGMGTATNAVAFHQVIHVALPRLIDGTKALDAFVNGMTNGRDICSAQPHSTTNIPANQIGIHEISGMKSGANRTALSLGLSYLWDLNTTFKVEYRLDRANLPVFGYWDGTYRKSNSLLGASVVVAF